VNNVNINIPKHHNLNKLHDHTKEYIDWFEDIDKNAPKWSGMSQRDGKIIVTYYEYPNGPEDVYNKDIRNSSRRTYVTSSFTGNVCSCC